VSDIDKSEDSSFKAALSSYQLGGSRSKQGMFILLIFIGSIIFVLIKQMGFTDFRNMVVADFFLKLILFPLVYVLYLVFKKDKPDEEV
tara:strand:- start:91 stop:354 length:264 start_codon:yes stop_codon:yes gene_type:complete